jgi:hypothetical protein
MLLASSVYTLIGDACFICAVFCHTFGSLLELPKSIYNGKIEIGPENHKSIEIGHDS